MVDGHAQQHQARIVVTVLPVLLPWLARSHLDRGRDELAEDVPVEQLATGADGRVPAAVLVDSQLHAGAFGRSDDGLGVVERVGHGLLQEHVLAGLQGSDRHLTMTMRRQGDVDDLHVRVVDDVTEVARCCRDAELVRRELCRRGRARGDADDVPASRPIGGQVALAHDLAGTDDADAIATACPSAARCRARVDRTRPLPPCCLARLAIRRRW